MAGTTVSAILRIEGMRCDHCVRAVTNALERVPEVKAVSVFVGGARITAGNAASIELACAAVERAGFEASVELSC